MNIRRIFRCVPLLSIFLPGVFGSAQRADQAWLKYQAVPQRPDIPSRILVLGTNALEKSASTELLKGLNGMFGRGEIVQDSTSNVIIIGTEEEFSRRFPNLRNLVNTGPLEIPVRLVGSGGPAGGHPQWRVIPGDDRYLIQRISQLGPHTLLICGRTQVGALYGTFAFLRMLANGIRVPAGQILERPAVPIRWVDEWDNIDGSIERGYGGRSIFFDNGHVRADPGPITEYARLLGSIGINGCNLNNVNNASAFLTPEMLKEIARIADAMRPYGVRVSLSADIASPQKVGGLPTFDPIDPAVKTWWQDKVNEIYTLIPDFGGFTVKADSEGQPGPASYGRSAADAANTLASALAPHNGVVLYRAFVYNHHLDWSDPKADRARAAYDIFHPLDGKFASNVVIQTKEGPIDFQAREPVSPLFGGMPHTSQAMELQITQEYLGQRRHLVYIAPMWKEVLDFDLRVNGDPSPVKQILSGETLHRRLGGLIGVACVGQKGWLGSPLSLANLYAFGRLAWNPDLKPEDIAAEWTRQTVSGDPAIVRTAVSMLMKSWPAYEKYTGPLGLQTLTDITGSHYGPNVEASERNGWGQWHKADHDGVGFDRSGATGTGFAAQYQAEVAKIYESASTTPDDLLLFFHHVPYTYKLRGGKTVIQYLYDSHYEGAEQAREFVKEWESIKGKVEPGLYSDVLAQLEYQAGHAIVWRDAVTQYFLKLSGIPDERGRAGTYPNRLEAEDARLTGYKVVDVNPWEDASHGKAVSCEGLQTCTSEWTYDGKQGDFEIAVQYFDLQPGDAKFSFYVNGDLKDKWLAQDDLPSHRPNGDNSTRRVVHKIALKAGDVIRIEGIPDNGDPAALDYIEWLPGTLTP